MSVSKAGSIGLHRLPAEGFIRANALAPILGIAVVTLWRWAANGKFPKPIKLGERVTVWDLESIHQFLAAKSKPAE